MKHKSAAVKKFLFDNTHKLKKVNLRFFDRLLLGRHRKIINKRFLLIIFVVFSLSITAGMLWGREITRKRTNEVILQNKLQEEQRVAEIRQKFRNLK